VTLELGQWLRCRQDWLDYGSLQIPMGTVAQVVGFRISSDALIAHLAEPLSGPRYDFPVNLIPGVWENCPAYAIPPTHSGSTATPD
jgi:hypothetical protein